MSADQPDATLENQPGDNFSAEADRPFRPAPGNPLRGFTTAELENELRHRRRLLVDERPHSRACGVRRHEHGPDCHPNCPTCGGRRGR